MAFLWENRSANYPLFSRSKPYNFAPNRLKDFHREIRLVILLERELRKYPGHPTQLEIRMSIRSSLYIKTSSAIRARLSLIQSCLDRLFDSFEVGTSSLDRESETPTGKGYKSDDSVLNATEISSDLRTLITKSSLFSVSTIHKGNRVRLEEPHRPITIPRNQQRPKAHEHRPSLCILAIETIRIKTLDKSPRSIPQA